MIETLDFFVVFFYPSLPENVLKFFKRMKLLDIFSFSLNLFHKTFKECIDPLRTATTTDIFPPDRKEQPSQQPQQPQQQQHPQQPLNVNQILTGESRPIKLLRVHNDLGMDDPQGITDDDNEPGMKMQCHHVF